jgi:hypothetical protein
MITIRVHVTDEDIGSPYVRRNGYRNPVAVAISQRVRQSPACQILVDANPYERHIVLSPGDCRFPGCRVLMPIRVIDWLRQYFEGRRMSPISFQIEIPDYMAPGSREFPEIDAPVPYRLAWTGPFYTERSL